MPRARGYGDTGNLTTLPDNDDATRAGLRACHRAKTNRELTMPRARGATRAPIILWYASCTDAPRARGYARNGVDRMRT